MGRQARDEVRVRLLADPASVPAARRFVRDALSDWQLGELVDDVALCVSELTSNAALHSASPYFDVVMHEVPGAVRICVDDQGPVPAEAVVARGGGAGEEQGTWSMDSLASTGRGLVIVSAIASDWGVEQTGSGKRVWAHLPHGSGDPAVGPEEGEDDPVSVGRSGKLPQGWHVVRLADCPVQLSLQQDRHLDELVRELQLVEAGDAVPSRQLADVIAGLLQGQAHARHMSRRIALDAAAAGLEKVDIDMTLPRPAAQEVQQLDHAVRAADRLCAQRQLLTLASSAEVTALRQWMVHEIVHQIEYGAAPLDYDTWLRRLPSPQGTDRGGEEESRRENA